MSFNSGFFIQQDSGGDSSIYNMSFDGINEKIIIPHNASFDFTPTDSFSITANVKLVNYNTYQWVLSKTDSIAIYRGYGMFFNLGQLNIYLSGGAGNIMTWKTDSHTFSANTEYKIGFSYNGNTLPSGVTIYVNGVAVSMILPVGILNNLSVSNVMQIGTDVNEGTFVNGQVGTIRIWDTVLTAGEMLSDYNGGVILNNPIKPSNLAYEFRGGQNALFGTQWNFPDESGNIINPSAYSVNMEYADRIIVP